MQIKKSFFPYIKEEVVYLGATKTRGDFTIQIPESWFKADGTYKKFALKNIEVIFAKLESGRELPEEFRRLVV